jgi:hypothetical protein
VSLLIDLTTHYHYIPSIVMSIIHTSALVSQGVELYRSILSAPVRNERNDQSLEDCRIYQEVIGQAVASGSLDSETASTVSAIVKNILAVSTSRLALERDCRNAISTLVEDVQGLNITGDMQCKPWRRFIADRSARTSKRRSDHDDSDGYRTSKRNCRPTTTKYLPSPSPTLTPLKSLKSLPSSNLKPQGPAQDPVRLFFLTHLASPYPTPAEKEKLCKKASITRRKLESDLTNWRRRSDWTDIMNTYCGGDKGAMKRMVGCIERGEEKDGELLERFGRMRAYLEKRDEQAGEWVHQVSLPRPRRRQALRLCG